MTKRPQFGQLLSVVCGRAPEKHRKVGGRGFNL
jgi:hypothetical protein